MIFNCMRVNKAAQCEIDTKKEGQKKDSTWESMESKNRKLCGVYGARTRNLCRDRAAL